MVFRELWLLAVLCQIVESRPGIIPCAPLEKDARHVNFDTCDGSRIEEYIELSGNAVSFSCKACTNLIDIPVNAFKAHAKTKEVDFSDNIHLHIPLTKCFLESKYIEHLKISNITYLPVLPPNVFECMPNLRKLTIGGINCMKTKERLETVFNILLVICQASNNGSKDTGDNSSWTDLISTTPSSPLTQIISLRPDEPSSTPKSIEPDATPEEKSGLHNAFWAIPILTIGVAAALCFCYREKIKLTVPIF